MPLYLARRCVRQISSFCCMVQSSENIMLELLLYLKNKTNIPCSVFVSGCVSVRERA